MFRRHVTKFLLASSCALGLAPLAASEAFAQGMGEGMGMRGGMHHRGGPEMMMRGLNLTEQQRDQIFKIHHDSVPAMREQMKQVAKARTELRQVAMADRFDEAKARQAADAQAKALSNMAVMRAQTMSRMRQVLTPEQRQKMDEMRNRHGGMEPRAKG